MAETQDSTLWSILIIPKDDTGLAVYLKEYKPFRLLALECDPSAFGSTLAREKAFDDNQWRARLFNPQATTFVARQTGITTTAAAANPAHSQRLLSSITLIGPGPVPLDLINQRFIASSSPDQTRPILHWHLNGVFTHPDARRLGIARTVVEVARRRAMQEAEAQDSDVVLTVVVYTANGGAKAWYEKMGFREYSTGEDQGRRTSKLYQVLPPLATCVALVDA